MVEDHSSPGFYSHVFLVPKKSGEWRLIIDLSRLNRFLRVPRFKMETTRSVATAILPKDWAVSLDLLDAYFHIPMHPDYQHFLRLSHEGKVYQFRALPFGLASAPLIFTTVVKAFVAPFHALGLKLHFYLDDWLLTCQCRVTLRRQLTLLLWRVRQAGWVVNEDKSELDPSQDFVFVGVRFRTAEGLMSPPQDRILVRQWRRRTSVSAREFLQLLGLLNSVADQVPSGRLHMRPLQLLLLSQWRPHSDPLDRSVRVPGDLLGQVWNFWGSEPQLLRGVSLAPPAPEISMFTDASLYGDLSAKGTWTEEESRLSINVLEMKAVILGVQAFQSTLRGKCITLFSDNSTVVAYIRKQGGTHSDTLCRLTFPG
jgi:hypothetical protein